MTMGMPLYIWRESAEMTSVSCSRASLTAKSVFPDAVGPVTIISFFKAALFSYYLGDVEDDVSGLLERLDRHELVAAMHVLTACEDVGAGESLE